MIEKEGKAIAPKSRRDCLDELLPMGSPTKLLRFFHEKLGKRAAMARGAKKPTSRLASISQPFTYGYFLVQQGRGMGTLQQGEIIDSMRSIREDIFTTAYASFIMELVDKLIDDESPKPHLFDILHQALQAISEDYDPEAISLFVEWKMLANCGNISCFTPMCKLRSNRWGICFFFCTNRILMSSMFFN